LTAVALALMRPPAAAAPELCASREGVSIERVEENAFRVTVVLPPFARLESETVACAYGAASVRVEGSTRLRVEQNCLKITADNPSPRPVTVEALVVLEPAEEPFNPPVALVAAAATVAAASYLSATESGRGKLFKALSLPAAYYIVKRSDVGRSAKRLKVLEYVKANPGATMRRISRETGVSFGEVQWHLSVLERLELVERVRIGKYVCYYPKGTPLEEWLPRFAERELGLKLAPETVKQILPKLQAAAAKGALTTEELTAIVSSLA